MQITSAGSNKISKLSFICVLAVVLAHVKWEMVGGGWTVFGQVLYRSARAILPFFFATSGFFLARHASEKGWWRKAIVSRIGSLGVPYVAWTALYFLEMAVVDMALNVAAGREMSAGLRGLWGDVRLFVGLNPFEYPALVPLWYVRNLFMLVALSPVLFWLLDRFRGVWLLALAVAHVGVLYAFSIGSLSLERGVGAVLVHCFSNEGVIYFSIGAYVARADVAPSRGFLASSFAAVGASWVAAIALIASSFLVSAVARHAYLAEGVSMPLLAYALFRTVSAGKWPNWIVSAAFPMFLMHPLFFDVGYGVARAVGRGVTSASFCWALFASTVLGSVALTWMLRRYCRPLAKILFGGR